MLNRLFHTDKKEELLKIQADQLTIKEYFDEILARIAIDTSTDNRVMFAGQFLINAYDRNNLTKLILDYKNKLLREAQEPLSIRKDAITAAKALRDLAICNPLESSHKLALFEHKAKSRNLKESKQSAALLISGVTTIIVACFLNPVLALGILLLGFPIAKAVSVYDNRASNSAIKAGKNLHVFMNGLFKPKPIITEPAQPDLQLSILHPKS